MIYRIKNLNDKYNIINYSIIIFGIVLCLIQFLYNRSLWLDEAFVANNIISRNFLDLLKPLDSDQVAPILFLLITNFFSILITNSELGLRLFPLLCYLCSLIIFYKICKLSFKYNISIVFSLSLFVFNTTLIYYSSELKQYMSDVLVLLMLYYTTIKYSLKLETYYSLFSFLGSFCIFLSNITPIVLLTCGFYIVIINYSKAFKVDITLKLIFIILSIWLVSFVVYYILLVHNHPSKQAMVSYWANCFLPNNPLKKDFYFYLFMQFKMVFSALISFGKLGYFFSALYLTGIAFLFLNKKFKHIILLITPIIVHLILSAFKLYPFSTRLILYSSPLYIYIH